MTETAIDKDFIDPTKLSNETPGRHRVDHGTTISEPNECMITLSKYMYFQKIFGECPMCAHKEHEDSEYSEEEAEGKSEESAE
jgi:hypothetical protein